MARNFVAASSNKLVLSSAPITATPLTIACWARPTGAAIRGMVEINDNTANKRFSLRESGAGAVASETILTSGAAAASSANMTINSWNHCVATFTSATARAAYLAGVNKGTNATSVTPNSLIRVMVGTIGGAASFFDGDIAEVALWNMVLSDADVAALATGGPGGIGQDARYVQLANLVAYWKLGVDSSLTDLIGGRVLTATGTTVVAGPSIYSYPPVGAGPYLLQADGASRFLVADGSGFILLADGVTPPPVVVTTKPTGGGGKHGHGGARYDRPKRIILPNGEHVTVETKDEYFRLMDRMIAGLVPEAVEEVPKPSKAQIKRAKAKVAQAALKLDIPAETIEQRIAEQMALSRAVAEARVYPVTRVSLRTKRLAPTLQDKMQFAEIARMLREAIQEENDEEEFIVNMVMELI